ncbi:hypothetical protein C8Q80DRAFT_1068096, partial [Daedaleopsis nitida]
QGRYEDRSAFLGIIDTVMRMEEHLHRGKSLKGLQYDTSYDQICTTMALISPRSYALIRAEFGGHGLPACSEQHRAKEGRFKAGIVDENFASARRWADSFSWTGPFILAADDTKVTAALRSYQDGD